MCSQQGAFALAARDSPDIPAHPVIIGNELIQIHFSERFPQAGEQSHESLLPPHSHGSSSPSHVDTTGSAHLRRLRGAGTSTAQCRRGAAWEEVFSWPLPLAVGAGLCTEVPSPHWCRKGRQGSVASLHPCKQGGARLLGLGSGRPQEGS